MYACLDEERNIDTMLSNLSLLFFSALSFSSTSICSVTRSLSYAMPNTSDRKEDGRGTTTMKMMHEKDQLSFEQANRRRIFISHQTIPFQLDDATGIKREREVFV